MVTKKNNSTDFYIIKTKASTTCCKLVVPNMSELKTRNNKFYEFI